MVNKKKASGAGFILVNSRYPNKILALVSHDGSWDLPKGTYDKTDKSLIYCAIRECYEECGILVDKNQVINKVGFSAGKLEVFVAIVNEEPKILKNFKTKIIEHAGYAWISTAVFKKNTKPFLKEILEKYENFLNKKN